MIGILLKSKFRAEGLEPLSLVIELDFLQDVGKYSHIANNPDGTPAPNFDKDITPSKEQEYSDLLQALITKRPEVEKIIALRSDFDFVANKIVTVTKSILTTGKLEIFTETTNI